MKSNVEFLQLPLGKETLYFTPDAILVIAGAKVAAFRYGDVEIVSRPTRFVEDSAAPSDTQVVGETWRFLNRNGGGEIDFKSASGLNERIHCSRVDVSEEFASAVIAMRTTDDVAASTMRDSSPVVPLRLVPEQNGSIDTVDVDAAYENETEVARSLALNHGKLWEFLLVEELLRSKLQLLNSDCDDLARIVPEKQFLGREFVKWVGSECTELSSVMPNMAASIDKGLIDALGKPGVSGDALKILSTVNSIFHDCRRFLDFERALNSAEVPSAFYDLKVSFRGITVSAVHMVEDLKAQWSRNTQALRNGATNFELKVHFETPPQAQIALEEIEKIKRRPELL